MVEPPERRVRHIAGEREGMSRSPASPVARPRAAVDTRWIERLAAIAGLLCIGWWSSDAVATARFQREAARAFDASRTADEPDGDGRERSHSRKTMHETTAPLVLGRIEIPAARVEAMIAAGTEHQTLDRAVGHVSGSAMPGSPGRCVLAGHRDSFFRGLGSVRPGDTIRITTRSGVRNYRVTSARIVPPQATEALRAGPASGVVLVTCYPFHFVGPAPLRYVVYAAPGPGREKPRSRLG